MDPHISNKTNFAVQEQQSSKSVFLLALLLSIPFLSFAQSETVLIIIPNQNAGIILDGLHRGTAKANSAFRITTQSGEHYIEAEAIVGGTSINKGEIVILDPGQQKILKLEFESTSSSLLSTSAENISVAELNFALPGTVGVIAWQAEHDGQSYPYPEFYYAFEEGDEILLNLSMSNAKGTNVISVSTYPDGVEQYSNRAFTELKDFIIRVPKRSIYRFTFATNHAFQRNAFLRVTRKPKSMETAGFNTKVTYVRNLIPYSVNEPQYNFINSGSNASLLGGTSRVLVPVKLPSNTVEWFYRFSASRSSKDIENVKKNFGLLGEVTTLLFNLSGVGAAMTTLAVESLAKPPGADYCHIYLIEQQHIQLFKSKLDTDWTYYPEGSRLNFKSGNVKVTSLTAGTYYLGIINPDPMNGVNTAVEVVAITAKDEYVMNNN